MRLLKRSSAKVNVSLVLETLMKNAVWTKISPSWDPDKVRQETGKLFTVYKLAVWKTLKNHPELLRSFQDQVFNEVLQDAALKGIANTPAAIVRYMAELTVNLAGGSVSICGDDREATISYDEISNWDQFKSQLSTETEQQDLQKLMELTLNRFSTNFGLKCSAEVSFSSPKPILRITFLKA
jgi:hypothetical protein